MKYEQLTLRNKGYISPETQEKIKNTTVLIAGCGVGSSIAEAALRMGFINIILLDGDVVDQHNLNRQFYNSNDVGKLKAKSLEKRLKKIYPKANIVSINQFLDEKNAKQIVANCDIIFDTIDFLDIKAITILHDEAFLQKKPIITAASAGWGAVAIYFDFKNKTQAGFRDFFGIKKEDDLNSLSYIKSFKPFFKKIEKSFDESIISAMSSAFQDMKDNKPCPAPHLSVGSFCVASLCLKIAVGIIDGSRVKENEIIVINLNKEVLE